MSDTTYQQIVEFLSDSNPKILKELQQKAQKITEKYWGNDVYVRALIEFSNRCRKDCFYCGLRKSNQQLTRYRMIKDDIIEVINKIVKSGFKTVVLQSGEDIGYDTDFIKDIVQYGKKNNLAVTLSIGERAKQEYEIWKDAGAVRYLLKQETYSKDLFKSLHPDDDFDERIKHRKWLKELGYQTGTGNIIGLPGQSCEDIAHDIISFADENADMIGIGPFISHSNTPLSNHHDGQLEMCLKVIALTRIMLPGSLIPATTAMGTIDPDGREKALQAGANVWMVNMNLPEYKQQYEIYPERICIEETNDQCLLCLKGRIASVGKKIGDGYGNSKNQ